MSSFLRNAYQYFYIFAVLFFIILLVNVVNGHSIDSQLYMCGGCIIVAAALHAWYYIRRRTSLAGDTESALDTGEALDLLEEALTALGCQPTTRRSDGKIVVAYQGEKILLDVRGNNVRIVDYVWRQVDKNDPDATPKLMAVNYANEGFMTKLIFGQLDDGNIGISTYSEFILHSGIKRLDLYLNMAMQSLLHSHRYLDETYLAMMSANGRASNDSRRPVGFATSDEQTNDNTKSDSDHTDQKTSTSKSDEAEAETPMRRPVGFVAPKNGNIE